MCGLDSADAGTPAHRSERGGARAAHRARPAARGCVGTLPELCWKFGAWHPRGLRPARTPSARQLRQAGCTGLAACGMPPPRCAAASARALGAISAAAALLEAVQIEGMLT